MEQGILLRSLLYVPGNRTNMIEKARSLDADALVLDLEDSVPPQEKGAARQLVKNSLPGLPLRDQLIFVRINSLTSGLFEEDLRAIVGQGLDGISLPKAESAAEIKEIDSWLEALERERGLKSGGIKLVTEIESARGIMKAFEIASSSSRLIGVGFGADDYAHDMGIVRSTEGMELFYPRSVIATAAIAVGIVALDSPYGNFRDEEGLAKEARLARQLGFKGKFLIHPSQIETVNLIFSLSAEEVAEARKIVVAFESALAEGAAATSVEGRMVDTPVAKRARKLLAQAEAIARKETEPRSKNFPG